MPRFKITFNIFYTLNTFLSFSFYLFFLKPSLSWSFDLLPYSIRLNSYNGLSTTTHGDIRTVGMAGATIGLSDTFIAAQDNPAGLAMALSGLDWNYTKNTTLDYSIQSINNPTYSSNLGIALNANPWGFSIGYINPYEEGQEYLIPGVIDLYKLKIQIQEIRLSAARAFFNHRFSLGLTLVLGQAQENFIQEFSQISLTNNSYAIGGTLGFSYSFPYHLLLGTSYALPMHYGIPPETIQPIVLPGFFKPIKIPARYNIGLGWIPNTIFRTDLTAMILAANSGTTLIRNDLEFFGDKITIQPKFGMAYEFIKFKEIQGTLFLGTYYEFSRVEGRSNRVHKTAGVEIKPWIFNIGIAIDSAMQYENYLFSLGMNVFHVMEKLDIIPTHLSPKNYGFLPNPFHISKDSSKTEEKEEKLPNPIEIGLNIPKKIKEKVEEFAQATKTLFQSSSPKKLASKRSKIKKIQKKKKRIKKKKKSIKTSQTTR